MPRTCFFIPPFLVARLADAEPSAATGGSRFSRTLVVDDAVRRRRAEVDRHGVVPPPEPGGSVWSVHDAQHGSELPGRLVRKDGGRPSDDTAAEEAARGVDAALALFSEVYGRSSWDGAGAATLVSVHYERDYANAFWNGTQLVFGDGDGEIFRRFTHPVDVLGHELSHAVTERTAGLRYHGQSGALNESLSDVFGSCLKQRVHGRRADEGDWLIGEGIFKKSVQGRALRDMANPGTAYDDPRLGKDPQPAHMDDYVHGPEDNGGVHINSGIPNRAFHLAALAIGGTSAEGAGQVWYDAVTSGQVRPDTDFAGFAAATVAAAGPHADAVRDAWQQVGVTPREPGGGR